MVNDAQKAAIKASWAGIDKQAAGTAFYVNLAANAPDVYAVFNLGPDPHGAKSQAQGLRVMNFVDVAVSNIDNMGVVQGKIDELASRHVSYGAHKAHFPPAKASFLDALASAQGASFNSEARSAWGAFYDFIAAGLSAPLP